MQNYCATWKRFLFIFEDVVSFKLSMHLLLDWELRSLIRYSMEHREMNTKSEVDSKNLCLDGVCCFCLISYALIVVNLSMMFSATALQL